MKILISVDIEGVAGVSHSEQVRSGNPEYEQARRWMTAEANAAIDGAFAGGATEVLVNDSHGSFRNLILQDIDARAHIITGKPRYLSMMSGVEQQCQAVFMVGYHAKSQEAGEYHAPGQADLFAQWPTVERVSSTTLRVRAASMYETIRILNCFSAMSFMLR